MSTGGVLPKDTERLQFRWWTPEDEPLAVALWGDPRVTALIDARPRLELDAVRERLQRELTCAAQNGYQYWLLFLRRTGEHVGCCGLKPRLPSQSVLELGFHLRPEHWGKGYATEAGRAVVTHAFGHLGAASLFAGHHPDNAASGGALLKLGFRRTGEELFPPTGLIHPAYRLEASSARVA